MKNRLSLIKKMIKKSKKEHQFDYDEENRMIIDMEINQDDNFLDEFSQNDYPIVSTQIADYIEKVITAIKPSEKFTLRIHSDCIDENKKRIYSKAIKNYYISKYIVEDRKLKNDKKLSFILGAFGIAVLALVIILEYSGNSVLWMRVFDIVAWVFIWEAVDIFAFKCKELKFNQLRYLNLIDMKIKFN